MSEEGEVNSSLTGGGGIIQDDTHSASSNVGGNGDTAMAGSSSDQQHQQSTTGTEEGDRRKGGATRGERLLKVLLTSTQAGALIGQGGVAVNELQKKTGTRIRVSHKTMMFPGTQFRVISVEGGDDNIREAMRSIVDVCFHDLKNEVDPSSEMVLALPSAAAPVIIGKQGAKVSELIKQTGCDIRLAKQSDEIPGVRERITTLKGKRDKILDGLFAILELMFADTTGKAAAYDNRTTTYEGSGRRDDYGRRDYRDDDHNRGYDRGGYGSRDYRDDYRGGGSRGGDYYRGYERGGYPPSMDRGAPSVRDPYYRGPPQGPMGGPPCAVGLPQASQMMTDAGEGCRCLWFRSLDTAFKFLFLTSW